MKPVQIPSFMSISTTVIKLCEFKEKKKNMDKMIGRGSGILVKYFIHSFVLTCSILYMYSHQKSN